MKIFTYIKLIWSALPQVIAILKTIEQATPDGTKTDDQIKHVIQILEDANEKTKGV